MLRIGSNNRTRAFTFIEVMVATAILALGIVLIYQGFFMSLDSIGYCLDYLRIAPMIDEKLWQARNSISHFGPAAEIETSGRFTEDNRNFEWHLSYNSLDDASGLYTIDAAVLLQRGRRKAQLVRSAYAVYEENE